MRISDNYSPVFGLKFLNNQAFKEVCDYAKKINKSVEFNNALRELENTVPGTVVLKHGKNIHDHDKPFSEFTLNGRTVCNTPYFDETYIEASYRCILDLSLLHSRYRVLTNSELNKSLKI